MSRAFVKEDVEEPERSGRVRSASGLPPGAVNYMTARGARRFREAIGELRSKGRSAAEIARLEQAIASATVVEIPGEPPESVALGATVTVRTAGGGLERYRIVGVDEAEWESGTVSWVSPCGRALLGAEVGEQRSWEDETPRTVKIEKIEY